MPQYCRIVSLHERLTIAREGRVDLNKKKWGIYDPGSAIFLFDCSVTTAGFLRSAAEAMADSNSAEQWFLFFETTIETEPDRSGSWVELGAVICRSPIELTKATNIRWQKHVPNSLPEVDSPSTTPMRQLIFISHATPEDNAFAKWLALKLTQHGYLVWCDVIKLIGGEPFWANIEEAIKVHAVKFLFCASEKSVQKPGVLREVKTACSVETF